jgi:hypothetical protein
MIRQVNNMYPAGMAMTGDPQAFLYLRRLVNAPGLNHQSVHLHMFAIIYGGDASHHVSHQGIRAPRDATETQGVS